MSDYSKVLVPYRGLEAMSIQQACHVTGISESTLRRWCADYGLGRRIGANVRPWTVSRVALAMFLANDRKALEAYHNGVRKDEIVARYYRSEGIGQLLSGPFLISDCPSRLGIAFDDDADRVNKST